MEGTMPHLSYVYSAGLAANCLPLLVAPAAAGNRAPNLINLAGLAGAALPVAPGAGPGLGAVPALGGCLAYSWPALTNAALTIGLYPPGMHPIYEATWRVANLRMAGYTAATGRLRPTPLLANLETQERRGLSYHMGINLGVYAARVSGMVFPRHLSRYAALNGGPGVAYTLNGAFAAHDLPDVVWIDAVNATCQVWEAKGRIGAVGAGGFAPGGVPAVLNGAMGQARRIASVWVPGAGLTVPNARVASVSRLDPATGNWWLHVSDPADDGKREREDNDGVEKERFYRDFYRPFVEMVAGSDEVVTVGGLDFVVVPVPGTSTRIGLDARIESLFSQDATKRRRGAEQTEVRDPAEVVDLIEDYIGTGYQQDAIDPDAYVSPEGILTLSPEENIEFPPA
jgi:hypothetical protein